MNNIFIWFYTKINEHRISIHAAQVAFFILVSFFPFMMFLITVIQYTPLSEEILLEAVTTFLPDGISALVAGWIKEIFHSSSGTILSITFITALWSGSKGVYGIAFELDRIYEVPKSHNVVARRILSVFYTVTFTVMIILSLLILVYGNQIFQLIKSWFPILQNFSIIFLLLRFAVTFILFIFYFLMFYRFIPRHQSTFREELPGAVLSAFLWIAFSYLYSLYVDYHTDFTSIYGSLSHIVFLMLWTYLCMIILFIGAMLNQFLKQEKKLHILASLKEIRGIVLSFLEHKI